MPLGHLFVFWEKVEGRIDWEFGIDIYVLLYLKQRNKDLL